MWKGASVSVCPTTRTSHKPSRCDWGLEWNQKKKNSMFHQIQKRYPMFPPGLEPRTFRVLGERDNHYTTETEDSGRYALVRFVLQLTFRALYLFRHVFYPSSECGTGLTWLFGRGPQKLNKVIPSTSCVCLTWWKRERELVHCLYEKTRICRESTGQIYR